MLNMIKNLTKATLAVAVTPVTLAADIVMIPSDSADGEDFAHRTSKKLKQAGHALDRALEVEE